MSGVSAQPSFQSRDHDCRRLAAVALAAAFAGWVLLGQPSTARATTITSNDFVASGFSLTNVGIGQGVTTPAGRGWDHLTFNLYNSSGTAVAPAGVALYLLSTVYTGVPSALSSLTTGYIASATSNGSIWTFTSSVALSASTPYYFYTNAAVPTSFYTTSDVYSGGDRARANPATASYATVAGQDMYFNLSGSQANPGPIPGAGLLSYLIVSCGGLVAFRKRLLSRARAWLAHTRSGWRKLSSVGS